ncbi:MAG: alcohol dehydrogenase catalytic domain-containing protein [Spirochaetia bacterium]|jgi:L-iditol 2-dehydrogenase
MKSKGIYGKKFLDIEVREREIAPARGQRVVVKVMACGVCGTDLNLVRDWAGDAMALGHEIAAEVVEVGSDVTDLRAGDRVVVEDCTMCGICDSCKSGRPDLCRNMHSVEGQPGMGQYMSVLRNSLIKCEGMDFRTACLTEPLAVSLTSVITADIPLGGSVLVLGNGPLGLMSALLARQRGASFVAMAGRSPDTPLRSARMRAAEDAGFDMVVDSGRESVPERVKSRIPSGMDRVIVSAPPQSLPDALAAVRFGGRIIFYGLHLGGKNVVPIDVNELIFRKISLVPAFAEPAINFPLSLQLLREGRIDAGKVITHTFGLAEAAGAMAAMVNGTLPAIKSVIIP